MYNIDNIILDDDIAEECFACDLSRCGGVCCTMHGGRGAPLMDEELGEIEKAFPKVVQFIPAGHREYIGEHGMVDGYPGNYATVCMNFGACVFVYYQDDIARCAFEKAFFMGLTEWQKPLSCHLFPIRIRRNNPDHLYYERISQCEPGRESGSRMDISLIKFVKDALIRKYGAEWYNQALAGYKQIKESC